MQFFRVRNFEKFQHYSDRRPPWIKLYRDLWDDPRFFSLSEADRYVLMSLFVVASQHDNKVSTDPKWLKAKLLTSRAIPLQLLVDTGWLEYVEQNASSTLDADNALATRYPSRARGETETEIQNTEPPLVPQISPPVGGGVVSAEATYSPDFEIFWTTYPRKVGKGAAWKAWCKLRPSRPLQDRMIAAIAVARASSDWTRDKGQYIPHPTTWLNQRRWDDTVSGNGSSSVHDFL